MWSDLHKNRNWIESQIKSQDQKWMGQIRETSSSKHTLLLVVLFQISSLTLVYFFNCFIIKVLEELVQMIYPISMIGGLYIRSRLPYDGRQFSASHRHPESSLLAESYPSLRYGVGEYSGFWPKYRARSPHLGQHAKYAYCVNSRIACCWIFWEMVSNYLFAGVT